MSVQKVGLLAWDNVSKEVKQARYHSRNAACKYKTNSMCECKMCMPEFQTNAIFAEKSCMWIKE